LQTKGQKPQHGKTKTTKNESQLNAPIRRTKGNRRVYSIGFENRQGKKQPTITALVVYVSNPGQITQKEGEPLTSRERLNLLYLPYFYGKRRKFNGKKRVNYLRPKILNGEGAGDPKKTMERLYEQ